jgi:WD40 repeat protein
MPINVTCVCGREYPIRDEFAGQQVMCPACRQVLIVPWPAAAHSPTLPDPAPRQRRDADENPPAPRPRFFNFLLTAFLLVMFVATLTAVAVSFGWDNGRVKELLAGWLGPAESPPRDRPDPEDRLTTPDPPVPPAPPPDVPAMAWTAHQGPIRQLALVPGPAVLTAGGSPETTVRLWDAETHREIWKIADFPRGIGCVGFAADGRHAVVGTLAAVADGEPAGEQAEQAEVELWDLEQKRLVRSLARSPHRWNCVALSPDGTRALAGGDDLALRILDTETGEECFLLTHTAPVTCATFSPDGHLVLSAAGRTVLLWDMLTGRERRRFDGHEDAVGALAFSPDGRFALSGGAKKEGALRLWDVAKGDEVRRFRGHDGGVSCLAFTPDGKQIASGGHDGAVRIWQVGTGRELAVFPGHTGSVRALAFYPDGKRLLSGDDAGRLKVWDMPPGVPELVRKLAAPHRATRLAAVRLLGRYGPDARSALPALLKMIVDSSFGREEVLAALKELGPLEKGDAPLLVPLVREVSFPPGRRYALEMLERLGPEAAGEALTDPLVSALRDGGPPVRRQAAKLLGQRGPAVRGKALRPLIDRLHDGDPEVVGAAREALKRLGPARKEEAVVLAGYLGDRSAGVRRFALESLAGLGKDAGAAVPELVRMAEKDSSVELRCRAIRTLVEVRPADPAVVRMLNESMKDADTQVCLYAVVALARVPVKAGSLPGLLRGLDHDDAEVSKAAGESLAEAKLSEKDVPALAGLLGETRKDAVRMQLVRLLGKLGPEAAGAVPALAETLGRTKGEERMEVVEVLGKIGPRAEDAGPALAALMDGADRPRRFVLAETLVKVRAREVSRAVPFLVERLYREDPADEEQTADMERARELLIEIGEPAVPGILGALRIDFRGGRPRTPRALLRALARLEAIKTLGRMGSKANTPEVLRVLAAIEGSDLEDAKIRQTARDVRVRLQKRMKRS